MALISTVASLAVIPLIALAVLALVILAACKADDLSMKYTRRHLLYWQVIVAVTLLAVLWAKRLVTGRP